MGTPRVGATAISCTRALEARSPGALVGWLFAVIGGAFALASLEFHGLISGATSDEVGIVIVLYGMGIGALNAYTFRPAARER